MSGHSVDGEEQSSSAPARNHTLTHVLYAQEAVGDEKKDSAIIDLIVDQFKQENIGNILANPAIASLGPSRIRQVVLGPKHVGVLLDDATVCRIPYHVLQIQSGEVKEAEAVKGEPSSRLHDVYARAGAAGEVEVIPLSGGMNTLRAAAGQAKYRRVMLSNRAYYRLRGNLGESRSYVLGAPRVPATNVPEELINNVQQVLQGKSRDVIIRELQRTGLNVNEAVNNLLSRDDGDEQDVLDVGGEHLIPEELLQILEGGVPPGSSGAVAMAESLLEREDRLLDSLASRAEMRYHFGGASGSKKPKANEKDKKKKDSETNWKNCIQLGEHVEWWRGAPGDGIPEHAKTDAPVKSEDDKANPVISITATSYQMYALHRNGKMYSWAWDESEGLDDPLTIVKNRDHPDHATIGTHGNPVIQMSSSNLRISILTRSGHLVSWLDECGAGVRFSLASETVTKISEDSVMAVQDLVTSDHLAAFRIDSIIHWCGIVPLVESTRSTKKEKEEADREKKKHVSFGEAPVSSIPAVQSNSIEFFVGQQVQMKKAPLYPAGSVAAQIDTSNPMIGVLLEDCWSATDHCRFRSMTPKEYDYELEVDGFIALLNGASPEVSSASGTSTKTLPGGRVSRKRTHDEADDSNSVPPTEFGRRRVEVWLAEDLVWIHEHRKRDVMTVQVVDNNLVAVKHVPNSSQKPIFQSLFSERLEMDGMPQTVISIEKSTDIDKIRLMRKEDLQVIDKCPPRAPVILQKELLKFDVDCNRTIVSMVADLNELRVLARSKHVERGMHMYRVSTNGKVISRRRVPVFLPSVERPIFGGLSPKLISFGDARTLFLRDTAGQLIPLQRDALNGFREPPAMHSQPILHIATACRPSFNVLASCEKNSQWQGSMLIIPGVDRPWHSHFIKDGSSLMQMVLYCDADGVSQFLDRLFELRMSCTISHHEFRQIMSEQLFTITSDLCSNVLHAAIRLTSATKNSEDSDKAVPDTTMPTLFPTRNITLPPQDVSMEDAAPAEESSSSNMQGDEIDDEEEPRWSRVLRSRPKREQVTPSKKSKKEKRADSEENDEYGGENHSFSAVRSDESGMPFGSPRPPMVRQKSALQIIDTFLKHPAMFYDKDAEEHIEYVDEPDRLSAVKALLLTRDLNGMTPFQSAINQRAYGAATSIWRALLQLGFQTMSEEQKLKYIFPSFNVDESHNADDSPLFILCYNDVCSFTWTGEDHINQDIYECKTCGLTGSLCCCSECALTCHRNHDCRLKRTSPTAYCDCWEKSSCNCKALIAGNELLREHLLSELLKYTRLFEYPNARNEHIMLFLARTVIRQTREQTYSQKRRSRYRTAMQTSQSSGTPEHNLNPPKFAKTALEQCCKNANVVMNSIRCGINKFGQMELATPGQLHFVQQSTSTHLDKLTFALSNKILKDYSSLFVGTLRNLLSAPIRDPRVDQDIEMWVGRFVRSLVRVLTLAINVSPLAPSTILAAEDPTDNATPRDPREDRSRYNQATFQVFHALVISKKESSKLSEKSASFVAMITRIMQFLQQLPTFAVVQLAIAADAIFEPVRDGMLRPMVNPALAGNNHDPMDILEKYFTSDLSFSEVLKRSKKEERAIATSKPDTKRVRRTSRRDTDRENGSDNRESMEDERSAGDRASESQETLRIRHDSTATSTVPTPRRRRLLSGNTTNDTNEDNEERNGQPREFDGESSSSDDDNDDDDDDDDEEEDDDDDDDDDDEDSDRPAEERQEDEEREEGDEHEQDEQVEGEIEVVDRIEVQPVVEESERAEEPVWHAYEPASPSPRQPDFDDNSSDSQEGGAREPAFVIADVAHPLEVAQAQPANVPIVRPVAENPSPSIMASIAASSAARERALEALAERRGAAASRVPGSSVPRIERFLPYRFSSRSSFLSNRREDSSNSQGSTLSYAAGSTTGTGSTAPAPASATAGNNNSQVRSVPPPTTTTSSSNQESSPASNSSKKSNDNTDQPSLETAREQLALTFSVLVRAGCDILSRMPRPVMSVYTKADDNAKRSQLKAQRLFGDILQDTFRWMGRVFESTEAKINFNETYEKSLVRPASPGSEDKRGRKDALHYIHSLLRLATDEAKDSLAHVDIEMLYPVALVADAYFHFLSCNVERPIELKQLIDYYEDSQRRHFREKCEQTDNDLMIGFFMRPVSLSWPGHLHDGAWDTLSGRHHISKTLKIEEECPMLGGPKMLTMLTKQEDLFRDPVIDETKRRTSSYLNDPVEEYTYNLLDRPFEYRNPGVSLAMVPHRLKLEREFISITRDFYHLDRTPDHEVKDYSTAVGKFPGYIGRLDDSISKFKDNLLIHSCNRERLYFSKWFKTLNAIGNRFYDKMTEALGADVAFENSIMLRRLASFETKQRLFNKATEKYRTQHSNVKEIVLDVRREPGSLFRDTMVQLHHLYAKRMMSVRSLESGHAPLAGTRLRVHFIDEPGEGTGVTRSFYTAFAESCMMDVAPFTPETVAEKSSLIQSVLHPNNEYEHDMEITKTLRKARREQAIRLRTHLQRLKTFPLNLAAPRFDIKNFTGEGNWTKKVLQDSSAESQPVAPLNWGQHEGTLRKIHTMTSGFLTDEKTIGRVMGIMCQLPTEVFVKAVNNDDTMRLHIQQILAELRAEGELDDYSRVFRGLQNAEQPRSDDEQWNVLVGTESPLDQLFEKAPYGEFYVPKIGNGAPMRLAAYRTVGRIMGICLSQGDIFPLRFSRHIFSYILKLPICWLDLGFYDPVLFNNLRALFKAHPSELDTDFSIVEQSADGKAVTVNLKPNGDEVLVNKDNVIEYVYKYAERVLVGKRIITFEAIREGILDVIPESMLFGLTPEDLRLIICGIESVSISVLQENTGFLDESRASQETLNRFKQWFWQVIESFTQQEKQELVFFWTGSPALPAAGKWPTSASVMLRPQEDVFLPTANTCISRLYVPVYSSKRVLRTKLLLAIKAKNFGFV
ncbi:E3 ubiquitin-protein ligase UBR5 [Caenorhabditis elegans]|uniref:E3 ubiquitin-protein ligase UBR5 n=1 Tax=Caenorhabditis elegans TaxID=6239 RepID=G5EDT9_CAEEL|nr:E3 ubiquitin-protein ligase UBR5 [Caenorhabditis elegans]CAB82212.1 E3 ubiquitin-protein ligase UBR5 [Caenorhabditis elegans]|eukprot:NP_492389.1 UBR E3 ubiquitin ligase homolog [Caenorhabditis elegans]